QGYNPGVGADLYPTNGDFTDWTYAEAGIPSYVVELTLGEDSEGNFYGFEFPDDEKMVQTVFEDNLEFALSLAESAADPAHPVSSVGIAVEDIYHEPLTTSYGSRQTIDILARNKRHGSYRLKYKINGRYGRSHFTPMLGESYNENPGVYFSRYHAQIKGQRAGDEVTYWIIGHRNVSGPYSYTVAQASDNPVLLLSAEDYTGQYPDLDATEPAYLGYYEEALNAAGIGYDVWDVTAQEAAPAFREVLSNYDAVVWYTGDDYAASVPGLEVNEEIVLELRDFMNYSKGTLMASGQDLTAPAAIYGLYSDNFFQYNLGAYLAVDGGGISDTGEPFPVLGEAGDPIFDGLSFNLSGGDSAGNQHYSDTFLATSYFLPHFDNAVAARYNRPGGPFDPHEGDFYVYSQMADQTYKRLGGTFTLPEENTDLSVWISFDIEAHWDYAFVEIREVGNDNWTTLPDENGLTDTDTGDSCAEGWVDDIHPHLAHYMDGDCNPTGTTGEWHALTGGSNGWKQMLFDLSAYAGKTVELYISYVSDWGVQNLGVFVDDITIAGEAVEGFETGMGDFSVTAPEENTPFNNWIRFESGGFAEGPVIRTPNSVLMGFGFEAVEGEGARAEIMERVMNYLLD
ncbi:MAG: immune inhibitor A, partial [Desulfobacteraceae bacterium]